ncbi:MAG: LacI family DNA-binding transcriptional regulator, partial [Lentisphaeria bacterium]|nr:LacI family DNA-binding transcriptional regulator [Lentisphaeria bacterium]
MNTKKKSLRAIARELNISAMTLYRVLNNAPGVSKKMRQQVIVALDKAGVLQARNQAKQKVVIDVIGNPYMINLAESLVNKISDLNYEICFTNHKENRTAFLRQAAEGNSIVFFSSPSQEILRAAKMENPDVFCINVCGSEVGDVIIGMHVYLGGTIAAEYLLQQGHRNIAA